jgi:hypothetical protein
MADRHFSTSDAQDLSRGLPAPISLIAPSFSMPLLQQLPDWSQQGHVRALFDLNL